MPLLQRFILLLACICLLAGRAAAQNSDLQNENVSQDFLLLGTLSGEIPLGIYAAGPVALQSLERYFASSSHRDFTEYISAYYAPLLDDTLRGDDWLSFYRGRFRLLSYSDSLVRYMADGLINRREGILHEGNNERFTIGRLSGRMMGSYNDMFDFYLEMSNGIRLLGDPAVIRGTDPDLSRTLKFNVESRDFFDRTAGYVQLRYKNLRVRYGREKQRQGYSPVDNLIYSSQASPADGLLIDFSYKKFRYNFIHQQVEGTLFSGDPVISKFVATQRFSFDPAGWISIGASDHIVYSGRGPDFGYLNPLGFFVSLGLGTVQKSNDDNSLVSFDMALRPLTGWMIYGNLVVDDINVSTITDSSKLGNDNKFAWQLGSSYLFPWRDFPLTVSAEYVRIAPFTFSHRQNKNSWTHLGAPLGYDMHPNSDRAALQAKLFFAPRITLTLTADYTRHGENYLDSAGNILSREIDGRLLPVGNTGGDILRGDGDFITGNSFLRGNISHTRRLRSILSAEFLPNVFTDLALQYTSRSGGNTPLENWWAFVELRLGY